jgi:methylated-DNA-[protein]-cysteine S-methyltransferase
MKRLERHAPPRNENVDSDYQAKLPTPFCTLGVRTEEDCVVEIVFLPKSQPELAPCTRMAEEVCVQVGRYLADAAFHFSLPALPAGTGFQRWIWESIAAIEPGRTRTYGDIAVEVGSAPRAVGQACGANRLPLLIPCHRVVAANGIGGFARSEGGFLLSAKRWLLEHERSLGC